MTLSAGREVDSNLDSRNGDSRWYIAARTGTTAESGSDGTALGTTLRTVLRRIVNQVVAGSSPAATAIFFNHLAQIH